MLAEDRSPPATSPLYRKMAVVMHCIIFLYAAAFWIQTGVLPVSCADLLAEYLWLAIIPQIFAQFLSKKLDVDIVVFGYLETVFAVAMLLGGPIFGRFGDLFGARAALLVAMASSLLSYAVLSQTSSIVGLFLSRVMAFMMHTMHGECW